MKYTRNDLWAFVWRADTHAKINIAAEWLKKNVDNNELFDDLMRALADQNRELSHREA